MNSAILLVAFIGTLQTVTGGFDFLGHVKFHPSAHITSNTTTGYYISKTMKSWNDAFVTCYLKGGQLATPFTPARDNALRQFMPTNEMVWVGGRSGGFGQRYRWLTIDQPVRFNRIVAANNCNVDNACLQVGSNEALNWHWSGASCSALLRFVCELNSLVN